jgi:hypothetical protein
VKLAVLVAVPAGLITVILPVVALTGTVALTEVVETSVRAEDETPLNFTAVTVSRLSPEIVTWVPTGAELGENAVITGPRPGAKATPRKAVLAGAVARVVAVDPEPVSMIATKVLAEEAVVVAYRTGGEALQSTTSPRAGVAIVYAADQVPEKVYFIMPPPLAVVLSSATYATVEEGLISNP